MSSSSTGSRMDRELCGLLVELQSEKVTIRHKAFGKMLDILNSKVEDFLSYMDSDSFDTEWSAVFNAVHQGIVKQSCSNQIQAKTKNQEYVLVLKKLVDLGMSQDAPQFTFTQLIDLFVRSLAYDSMLENFGEHFCQMLKTFVLSSQWNLTSVTYKDWSDILDSLFTILETKKIPMKTTASCLLTAVMKFLENCSMQTLLGGYLSRLMEQIRRTGSDGKVHRELMNVALHIVQANAVDCRTNVMEFMESVLPFMVEAYKETNISEGQKRVLFRLMHLSLIVFFPGGNPSYTAESLMQEASQTITDEAILRKTLREYHYIIKSELKTHFNVSYRKEVPFCDGFVDFAARLCYTIYWNEDNWQEKNSDESTTKKNKQFDKLQSIMEMVGTDPTHWNWRWLVILSAVLSRYGAALQRRDYRQLLQLLCTIQPLLQTPVQHGAFFQCCSALLRFEEKPAFRVIAASMNDDTECGGLWSKIIATTLRSCTTTGNVTCSEPHLLLQLLIRHRKYPSIGFLNGTVLEAFYTHAIVKTDMNVGTILAILETLPSIECLGKVNEVAAKLFDYLYLQTRETQLKNILHSKERLSAKVLAKISILSVITKHAASESKEDDAKEQPHANREDVFTEDDEQLRAIEQRLSYHNVEELIKFEKHNMVDALCPTTTYNVVETLFASLCETIHNDKHVLPEDINFLNSTLVYICYDVELYLEMLNLLYRHRAYNEEQCRKSMLHKKVLLKFQQLNTGFGRLLANPVSLTFTELMAISERLLAIFRGPYARSFARMFQETDHELVLRWVLKQIDPHGSPDTPCVTLLSAEQLTREQQLKRCFYNIAVEYLQYDGPSASEVHDLLDNLELNVFSSLDLFYLFDMCQICLRQPTNETVALWVLTQFVQVCKHHHSNVRITERIIDLYAVFIEFVKPYDEMVNNATIILNSFIKQCAKHTYSTELQAKIFAQVKYLLRAYPQHIQKPVHENIYLGMVALLNGPSYRVKLELVENILCIMQPEWAHKEEASVPAKFYEFQSRLYEAMNFDDLLSAATETDERMTTISACTQLLLGIFHISFMLRRRALRDFVLLVYAGHLNPGKIMKTVQLASVGSIHFSKLLRTDLDTVLEHWLSKGYRLMDFPYRLAGGTGSIEEFIQTHKKHVAFVILCMQPERFEQFCGSIGVEQTDMVKAIIPKCISFLMPKYTKCEGMPEKYSAMANRMHKGLGSFLKSVDLKMHMLEIVKQLTYRLNDSEELGKLVEQEFPKCFGDSLSLSSTNFGIALEHLKKSVWDSQAIKFVLLSNLALKNCSLVERILMEVKRLLWTAEELQWKMIHFWQYTVLLDHLKEYISQQKERSFKPYLIRDVVYFHCNLLTTVPTLRLAILNSFGRFLEHALTSDDVTEMLSKHLNFIVSSLVEVECVDPTSKISSKSLSLLRLLIVQHSTQLGSAIGKLNYLPNEKRFEELRLIIRQTKMTGGEHPSPREEIDGLIRLPSLQYEDLAALRIVLTSKKSELKLMCDELSEQNVTSAVNSEESLLHRLINVLLEIVRNSPFEKQSMEALRCLSEIGPVNLGTMLLKTDFKSIAYETINNSKEAIERCVDVLLDELNHLLMSKNISIQFITSQVCYKLLHGKSFHALAAKSPLFHSFLGTSTEEVRLFSYTEGRVPPLKALLGNDGIEYHVFVQQLSSALLRFLENTMFKKLVEEEPSFAEKIVPMLVQITVKLFADDVNAEVGAFVNGFFHKFSSTKQNDVQHLFKDPKSVQLMLTIVECIRIHNARFPQFKIAINYLPIAKASHYCQAHFKAILYGDLWYRDELEEGNAEAMKHPDLLEVMKCCHLAIDLNDAVKPFLNPILQRTEYYRLEQNYAKYLIFQDATVNMGDDSSLGMSGISRALKDSSLYGLARSFCVPQQKDYECAWRLADWNLLIDDEDCDTGRETELRKGTSVQSLVFERAHYKALKCLALNDELAVESAILEGRRAVSETFKLTSIESAKHIYHNLCRLRQLQQIEDFSAMHFCWRKDSEQEVLHKWKQQDALPYSDFTFAERILSQRLSIFSTAGVRAKRGWVLGATYSTLLDLIHESRIRGFGDCALRNIALVGRLDLPVNVKSVVMLEDAQLNWLSGHKELARSIAREVMDTKQYNDPMVNAVACRVYGEFQAENHLQEVKSLCSDYFKQAEKCVKFALSKQSSEQQAGSSLKSISSNHRCFDEDRNFVVQHTVAKYADREFVRLSKVLRSPEWEARRTNLKKMEEELARLRAEASRTPNQRSEDITRSLKFTMNNLQRDKKAAEEVEQNRLDYLALALCYYMMYAKQTSVVSDMVIFRITALWLNNQQDQNVRDIIEESLHSIPSYKFIAVLPQLTPRVSAEGHIGMLVQKTLITCAVDHPHHTLPYVFAQLHAFKDLRDQDVPTDDHRMKGICQVFNKLVREPTLANIVREMERMNLALIEMANKSISTNPSFKEYTMTKRDLMWQLQNLELIHCPTVELPVSNYRHLIVGIRRWDPKIVGVGGINAPKKLSCMCLDGTKRTQLLKGKDDMRQDAVMQQVFGILNILLRHDKETAHRKLSVRTYKVVPLSRQSGILEWCTDTTPIGAWLLSGHVKYRPQDIDPISARKKLANIAQAGLTVEKKLQNYRDICSRLRPVFRHYFHEHYLKPGVWFERQQNYTRSVAASSMIGYMLGIGDRHVQNILIDKSTGEVIHIDFGIAFEMGKNLPTPETIPFRLTRDIVDGMGISGVEGVFRKSCEKTLEVLRKSHTVILTILEVLLYDPLYSWNVLSNKKATRQQQYAIMEGEFNEEPVIVSTGEINVTAERALMLVEKKLQGKEDDKYISVEGQVQMLIFNATNERNLCQLYAGWQPYL